MSRRVEWKGPDDLQLIGDAYGDPAGLPVLLLHGGGQTRHAWGRTGEALGRSGFFAVTLDARGHGESSWAPGGNYNLDDFISDLKCAVGELSRRPAVVGASLGGLTGLLAESEHEGRLLEALILVDVAHRLEVEGVLRIVQFMQADYEKGFATLDEAADAIAAFMPHRPRPKDLSGLSKNLRRDDDGRYRWHWDPLFIRPSQRNDPNAMKERLTRATEQLDIPTLLVRGRLSDVLSEESARDFLALAPHAEYVDVADAAHMIAGDRNDAFTGAVVDFLSRL
jgi:pimeloyl-ACP methyl ester carboxylesterase